MAGGIYLKHKDLYAEYQKLKPRKQAKFYEAHRTDLMMFDAAERYFKGNYISTNFSLKVWKQERANLPAELNKARHEYSMLKSQFSEVEAVHRTAENIVREINLPQQKKTQKKDMGAVDFA